MAQTKARRKRNKSQLIRETLASGITKPSEIVSELKKRKVTVSAAMVSQIKAKTNGKQKRGKTRSGDDLSFRSLEAAHVFAKRVGSLSEAKAALLALEKLQS